jgi:ankyrin repeat protein
MNDLTLTLDESEVSIKFNEIPNDVNLIINKQQYILSKNKPKQIELYHFISEDEKNILLQDILSNPDKFKKSILINSHNESLLYLVCADNKESIALELIKIPFIQKLIEIPNNKNDNVLSWAVYHCMENLVNTLFTNHFKSIEKFINLIDYKGWSLLHWACYKKSKNIATLLITYTDISIIGSLNFNNESALYWACYNSMISVCFLLISILRSNKEYAFILNKCDIYGYTPLHWASKNELTDVIKLL